MRESDKMQVNWHHINWRDFNETISMIERADSNAGVVYEPENKVVRPRKHVVRKRVRDRHLTH